MGKAKKGQVEGSVACRLKGEGLLNGMARVIALRP